MLFFTFETIKHINKSFQNDEEKNNNQGILQILTCAENLYELFVFFVAYFYNHTIKTMNYMRKFFKALVFVTVMLMTSCTTPLQELVYMNGIQTGMTYQTGPHPDIYHIRPDDQLFIQVISDDPMDAAIFNITNMQTGSSSVSSSSSMELITYLVDQEGMITFPQLGKLMVNGLTIDEVTILVQKGVDQYLEGASVFVKLVNRSITILGEVQSPGQKPMVKNQLTIFEAIGTAGGLNDWGNRKNVKLVREMPEGKHVAEINLTDPGIINSPYYYILPHDVLVVEPSRKVYGAKTMPYATPVGIASSVLSIILSIITITSL